MKMKHKKMLVMGLLLVAMAVFFSVSPHTNTTDAVVVLYFTGHMSFQDAMVALTALGLTTGAAYGILTSSAVASAIGTGMLDAVIERVLIAFLGFWGWIILAAQISLIA